MNRFISRLSREVLTKPLERLEEADETCVEFGKAYIREGCFLLSTGEFYPGTEGQWLVNLNDLIVRKHTTDQSRLNGCCGLDGCDGRNLVDSAGNEVGTEQSDCWMPHCAALDPEVVEIENVEPQRGDEPSPAGDLEGRTR